MTMVAARPDARRHDDDDALAELARPARRPGGAGGPAGREPCAPAGSGWSPPGRRSVGGSAATCTTRLGPTLAGLAMQLGALRACSTTRSVAAERLARLEEAARDALDDVRRVAAGCARPRWTSSVWSGAGRHAAEVGLGLDVPGRRRCRLPAAVEVAAYRIGQQALATSPRTPGSTCGVAAGRGSARRLCLEVRDRGTGVGQALAVSGSSSMRERAEELGGSSGAPRARTGRRSRPAADPGARPEVASVSAVIRVVLADDHPMFREGLRFTLGRAGRRGRRRGRRRDGGARRGARTPTPTWS